MKLLDVWINCPDRPTAQAIAQAAVDRRLAACANTHPEIESVYRWRGKVERAREVPLLLKTRPDLFDQVAALARSLHPDETPAIHGIEAAAVTADYLDWLHAETRGDEPSQDPSGLPT
jgi:periplasmic divalent cation tolerance protein